MWKLKCHSLKSRRSNDKWSLFTLGNDVYVLTEKLREKLLTALNFVFDFVWFLSFLRTCEVWIFPKILLFEIHYHWSTYSVIELLFHYSIGWKRRQKSLKILQNADILLRKTFEDHLFVTCKAKDHKYQISKKLLIQNLCFVS